MAVKALWPPKAPALGLGLLAVAIGPGLATAQERLDVFDTKGHRTGHVVADERIGRIDLFDRDGRRTGFGRVAREGVTSSCSTGTGAGSGSCGWGRGRPGGGKARASD
jgi:hypothetical protein